MAHPTVLLWLEREVGNGRWTGPIPEMAVHSANPVGRDRMLRVIRTIQRLHAKGNRPEEGPKTPRGAT